MDHRGTADEQRLVRDDRADATITAHPADDRAVRDQQLTVRRAGHAAAHHAGDLVHGVCGVDLKRSGGAGRGEERGLPAGQQTPHRAVECVGEVDGATIGDDDAVDRRHRAGERRQRRDRTNGHASNQRGHRKAVESIHATHSSRGPPATALRAGVREGFNRPSFRRPETRKRCFGSVQAAGRTLRVAGRADRRGAGPVTHGLARPVR